MKKPYQKPELEKITFSPADELMDSATLPGTGSSAGSRPWGAGSDSDSVVVDGYQLS